jgi:hypothetical protein
MEAERLHFQPQSPPASSRQSTWTQVFSFWKPEIIPQAPFSLITGENLCPTRPPSPADFWGLVQLLYQSPEPVILLVEIPGEKL